jgi:predicted acetyltransferase
MAYRHRPLTADDLDQAWRLDLQLFNEASTHRDAFDDLSEPERFQGVFDDKGRLVAMARVIPYRQYFGGRSVCMGGLSSVGVAPEVRGRGLAVAACRATLADMRERGEVISALFPGTTGLYRKLGWELSGAFVVRHVACHALRNLPVPPTHRIERAEASDLPRIKACYETIAPSVNGFLERPASSWYFLEKIWDDFFVYLSLDASGKLDGYVAYDQKPPQPGEVGYTIRVREWMAASRGALSSLFWTLGSSSTMASIVRYKSSPEDPLLLLVDDQVERVQGDLRFMTRIVDPVGAIAQRGFAASLEVDVPLVLEEQGAAREAESLAPNAGAWRLVVSKGEGQLERTGEDEAGAPRMGIGAFASLYTGWGQTAVLERAGLLEGGSAAQRAALDAAFAGPTPWIPEEF